MDDLVEEVNRALRARGWSARHASMQAVGSPELVRDMRRGYVTSVAKFRTLCAVLGLEFYVGPPRATGLVDEHRLEAAVEATERALEEGDVAVELDPRDKARVVAAVYGLLGDVDAPADRPPVLTRVRRVIQAMTGARRRFSDSAGG